ncbi:MAG: 2-amino-4-hydroxy-6-hydroxymethyldihydropteridine diphosphokinase [Polaromonas sp.]|nr:2-amino-4-hydroxy-6-hydroxymethyldihydropteridine diphosphokinase [Polaromonas sp.]
MVGLTQYRSCAPERVTAFVGLGANLGDAAEALHAAIKAFDDIPLTQVRAVSSFYRSQPIDSSGPDYLNAVAELQTALTAPALLCHLQAIEQRAGRERPYRNAPRTLDLDLLLFGSARIDSPALTVPHPRMAQRAFVLQPLAEIAPGRVTPAELDAVAAQAIVRVKNS